MSFSIGEFFCDMVFDGSTCYNRLFYFPHQRKIFFFGCVNMYENGVHGVINLFELYLNGS